jgi:hypothetical protein
MKAEVYDYPQFILIHSESDEGAAYLVDLCAFPYDKNTVGKPLFNGRCQCKDFIFRCEPNLKKKVNKGKVFRCKHVVLARAVALDYLLPYIKANNPNKQDEYDL